MHIHTDPSIHTYTYTYTHTHTSTYISNTQLPNHRNRPPLPPPLRQPLPRRPQPRCQQQLAHCASRRLGHPPVLRPTPTFPPFLLFIQLFLPLVPFTRTRNSHSHSHRIEIEIDIGRDFRQQRQPRRRLDHRRPGHADALHVPLPLRVRVPL